MSPPVIRQPGEIHEMCERFRRAGKRVGFVPTMGALHDGHLSLVTLAREHTDVAIVSIFVNPTQFGPNEDFARYPRDLASDAQKLASVGADVIFAPEAPSIYPAGESTRVSVGGLTDGLCGPFRPGHFAGVTTVVAKLFALVGSSTAIFGRKDYQQLAVIRRMTRDLLLPIQLVGAPIVRESDGLAMSSRNQFLSPEERNRALGLSRGLRQAAEAFEEGERNVEALQALAAMEVRSSADSVDYVSVADAETLQPLTGTVSDRALLAIACHVGNTRLIDNFVLGEEELRSLSQ